MRSYNKSRRSRSTKRARMGGSSPPPNNMNVNVPANLEMPNAAPVPLAGPAPLAGSFIREVRNQNALMAPDVPAGRIGLVFGPPVGAQPPGAQHAGRKSHRRKSHRRKSHRR
jgi:hypothetical protein